MPVSLRIIKRLLFGTFFLIVGITLSGNISAQESVYTEIVEATGTGIISGEDTAGARGRAISDGLVSAVEAVVSKILPLEVIVQNFEALNKILYVYKSEFIHGYKVLNETQYGNLYRVMVQATVSVDKVKQQLGNSGILPGDQKRVKILFLIAIIKENTMIRLSIIQ